MKSKISWGVSRTLVLFFLLFLAARPLTNPYPPELHSFDLQPFGPGNAPEIARSEIIHQLRLFQEGYEHRDAAAVEDFSGALVSRHNALILGTMPREVYVGHVDATTLIGEDWASWGDCTFLIDQAHVSAHGDTAWIATVGYVEFDLSRFLVLPLRLSGVLVKEDGGWRFQYLQYQFDLDVGFNLMLVLVLGLLTLVSLVAIPAQVILLRKKD